MHRLIGVIAIAVLTAPLPAPAQTTDAGATVAPDPAQVQPAPATGAQAGEDGPALDDIRARFQLSLPGYWSLNDLTVVAAANYGTAVEPLIKQRFTAHLQLAADTYAAGEPDQDVTWLVPVAAAGDTRTAYGIATSTLHAGAWQTEFELENDPTAGSGQPRDFFAGRVIVRGSEEEIQLGDQLAAARMAEAERLHQEELAARARAEQLLAKEREAELARLAHDDRLEQAERARAEQEVAAAEAERQALLDQLAERARKQFSVDLPGVWQLASFTAGDAAPATADGRVERTFSAEVKLLEDTFVVAEADGDPASQDETAVIVAPVAAAGEVRKLYGRLQAEQQNGAWQVEVGLDNDPMASMGQPIGFFQGRVLLRDSEAHEAYRQEQLKLAMAEQKRLEGLAAEERAAERARLDDEEKKQAIERQHELTRLADEERKQAVEREAELAARAHQRDLKAIQNEVELARAAFQVELEKRREAKAEATRTARERELAALRAALASDDIGQRTHAVETALSGKDTTLRIAALRSALDSGDQALKRMALLDILSRSKTISGTYGTRDRTFTASFAINVRNFTVRDGVGNLVGNFAGSAFHSTSVTRDVVSGTVSGTSLNISNQDCSISARLNNSSELTGTMTCDNLATSPTNWGDASVAVTIPVF